MGSLDLLEDACLRLPHTTRAMFGGHGLFAPNGGMFAGIVDDDRMILKFAEGTPEHAAFLAAGGKPWTYEGGPKPMTMREWLLVPLDHYDSPTELAAWAAKAHRIVPAKPPKKAKAAAGKKSAKAGAKKAAKKSVEKGAKPGRKPNGKTPGRRSD